MTKRVVEHEIKLEKSVKIILGVLALGVLLNAFAPAFSVREAFADILMDYSFFSKISKETYMYPVHVKCDGCN